MGPEVGQLIAGKYRLTRLIGVGGMGCVFEATHELLRNSFALKFLNPNLATRPTIVERFLREAKVSASIRSAHVVHVHDVDTTVEGLPYIVMELLEGESLQQCLDRCNRLPLQVALDYALQILNGLEVAHARGVVHRDLKPDNVFIVPMPQGHLLKLLDFGIAKVRSFADDQRGLTRPGSLMGTLEYMAPEQVFSADAVDHRADLYALGVILFEMIAGVRPVNSDDPSEMAALVMTGRVPKLVDVVPGAVPQGLSDAIDRALAGRVDDRFGSAAEMRSALHPFLAAAPAVAGNSNTGTHPPPDVKPSVAPGPFTRQPSMAGGVSPTQPDSEPGVPPPVVPMVDALQDQTVRTGTVIGDSSTYDSACGVPFVEQSSTEQMRQYMMVLSPQTSPPMPSQVSVQGSMVLQQLSPQVSLPVFAPGSGDMTPPLPTSMIVAIPSPPSDVRRKKTGVGLVIGLLLAVSVFGVLALIAGWSIYNHFYVDVEDPVSSGGSVATVPVGTYPAPTVAQNDPANVPPTVLDPVPQPVPQPVPNPTSVHTTPPRSTSTTPPASTTVQPGQDAGTGGRDPLQALRDAGWKLPPTPVIPPITLPTFPQLPWPQSNNPDNNQ